MCVCIKLISVCKEVEQCKKEKTNPVLFFLFFSFQILEILPDLALTLSIFMEEWSRNTVVKDILEV